MAGNIRGDGVSLDFENIAGIAIKDFLQAMKFLREAESTATRLRGLLIKADIERRKQGLPCSICGNEPPLDKPHADDCELAEEIES